MNIYYFSHLKSLFIEDESEDEKRFATEDNPAH